MHRVTLAATMAWLAPLFVLAQPAPRPAQQKVLKEVWEAAYLDGAHVGHSHRIFREATMADRTIIMAETELQIAFNKFGQIMQMQFSMGDNETTDGKVLSFVVRQSISKDRVERLGRVDGKQLILTTKVGERAPTELKMNWNDEVLGLHAIEKLFQARPRDPNTTFDVLKFEPVFDTYLVNHVAIKDIEETPMPGGKKAKLLRTETRIDKIMGVDLPPEMAWVDDQGEVLKRSVQLPGLGELVSYKTTKEVATAKGPRPAIDVGISQLLRVNREVPRFWEVKEAVYRVKLKDVEEPQTAFATDDRQKVKLLEDGRIEITVKGLQKPREQQIQIFQEPPAEYLRSNHYLKSDDARVKDLARRAVGNETDPWRKATAIEGWVDVNIRDKNNSEAFAPADEVAKHLEGDCTEHAVLAAAMCRAVGIPARTAVGLVHVPPQRAMGYHMWIEVWIAGQWYALDPTIGRGSVDACHLKITDQHWNDTQGLLPFLPVTRVLGKIQMEIVSVKYDEAGRR